MIILINPNSTQAMTDSALAAARAAAPDLVFEGWTSALGPASIQGPDDGEAAVPPLLDLVTQASDAGAAAIVIACFDDTGLAQARAQAACPVIGIGEASYILAGLYAGPAAVVTTVPEAVPVIRANIAATGHAAQIPQVVAANVPVLMLEEDTPRAARAFADAVAGLTGSPRTVILGCAGAVTVTDTLRAQMPYRFVDGVTAAARLCRALV